MGSGMKPATKRRVCILEVEGGIPPKEDSKVYWNSNIIDFERPFLTHNSVRWTRKSLQVVMKSCQTFLPPLAREKAISKLCRSIWTRTIRILRRRKRCYRHYRRVHPHPKYANFQTPPFVLSSYNAPKSTGESSQH